MWNFLCAILSFWHNFYPLRTILEFHICGILADHECRFSVVFISKVFFTCTQYDNFTKVELIEFFISLEIIWCPYQFLSLYTIMKFPPVWNFYNVNNLNKIHTYYFFDHFTNMRFPLYTVEFYVFIFCLKYQNSITGILFLFL